MSSHLEVLETPRPKRSASSMLSSKETPLKIDWASSGVFMKGSLAQQKKAVTSDLGAGIPEVGIDYMLRHVLPQPSSELDVNATLQALERIKSWKKGEGWEPFSRQLPSAMSGTEEQVYNTNMETIVKHILGQCKFPKSGAPFRGVGIGTSPTIAPISRSNVRTRPDACGLLENFNVLHTSKWYTSTPMVGSYHWFNIVYTLEYKKKCTVDSRNDNVLKILWSLHHIMNVDHRRRFTYGITIEDTTARVWFCCRQIVMVSTAFDFMEEPKIFIQLFASLHYSDSASVGYDPTMAYAWNEHRQRLQLRIDVHEKDDGGTIRTKTYMTTGDVISDESQIIRSRATRVYEAYDISDNSKALVVIKDLWVDVNRPMEAYILADITQATTEDEKSLFLTVLHHGIVQIKGQDDVTEGIILRGAKLSTGGHGMGPEPHLPPQVFPLHLCKEVVEPSKITETHNSIHTDEVALFSTNVLPSWMFIPKLTAKFDASSKAHYRLVFKERGQSLHHLSLQREIKLSSIIIPAFCDIIRALEVMWRKRYVHRDVSAANIIIYNGRARLIDLEFAKKHGTSPSNPIRTGSYSFIATEILSESYLSSATVSKPVYCPLHDLESLWWLGIWFTFCHYTPQTIYTSKVQGAIEATEIFGQALFSPVEGPKPDKSERLAAIIGGDLLLDRELERCEFPAALRRFCTALNVFREHLIQHFFTAGPTFPRSSVDPSYFYSSKFTLYKDLLGTFSELIPDSENSGLGSVSTSDEDCHLVLIQYLQKQIKKGAGSLA